MVYEYLGKNIKLRRLHEFASNSSSKTNNSLQLTLFCFLFSTYSEIALNEINI